MHTNHTSNYELSQFISTDKPTFLGDYNGDMQKIDTAIAGVGVTATGADTKADSAITAANSAASTAADAATLANTANTNANSALATAGNAATAASAAQSTADSAVSAAATADGKAVAVDTKAGDLANLTTTDKTSLVAAINEVNAKPSGASTAADVTYDNTVSGLTADDVQEAIDELAARNAQHVYSNTETEVGKWLNNESVYEKSYEVDNPTNDMVIDSTLTSDNMALLSCVGGYVEANGTNPLPMDATISGTRYNLVVNVVSGGVKLFISGVTATKARITIRYIKISQP